MAESEGLFDSEAEDPIEVLETEAEARQEMFDQLLAVLAEYGMDPVDFSSSGERVVIGPVQQVVGDKSPDDRALYAIAKMPNGDILVVTSTCGDGFAMSMVLTKDMIGALRGLLS